MTVSTSALFNLLPAILRIRDAAQQVVTPGLLTPDDRATLADLLAKQASGGGLSPAEAQTLAQLQQAALAGPLASLLAVLTEQVAVLQEDLDQLYDDQFIETCADWVAPYIGDLIGYQPLHGVTPAIASPRAEVAHTIGYRRRKGTITVLEQLARDVTGWNATAVEFFQRLIVTQFMNHIRPQCLATPDFRQWEPLERVGTAFDTIMRSIEVRRIESTRGRYNIPNIGIFLWTLGPYTLSRSPAVSLDARRWRFHPLDIDTQLYTSPQTETQVTQLATPLNVPEPISRRVLNAGLANYYTGADNITRSLRLYAGVPGAIVPVPIGDVCVCNLSDSGASWNQLPPAGLYAIDPVLGRIALPPGLPADTLVEVDFNYAFSADMGGGEYERAASLASVQPPPQLLHVPNDHPTIAAALTALGGAGVVEITDSGRYAETLAIAASANQQIVLRAADKSSPTLVLGGPMTLSGGGGASIALNGLRIVGAPLEIAASAGNALGALTLSHCTLVPGLSLKPDCTPASPGTPSLSVALADVTVAVDHSILGAVSAVASATLSLSDSIVDATSTTSVAYAAIDGVSPGASLSLSACTVIGKINAQQLTLVTDSILLAALAAADSWKFPVNAARRQEGCVRFSYVPSRARVPRRYQCLPESAPSPELALPRFTSLRYGFAAYAQLADTAGASLQTGADDEGQPGAFHAVFQPQRESNLQVRLGEYLRTSLEAGIFHED
ncbi:MAG: hypothetical protein ACREC0_05370 [Methylocella sp.]